MLANNYINSLQVAYILSLGVVKDFRRHGIGELSELCALCLFAISQTQHLASASLLLDNLISYLTSGEHDKCKAIYLHVLTTNAAAIRFYERRNFHLHNYLPYYYSIQGIPQDGYSYVLYINGGQPPWTLIYPFITHYLSSLSIITSINNLLLSC